MEFNSINTCLIKWVIEQQCTSKCIQQIKELVEAQPPTTLTLYRGHTGGESIIRDAEWWSTSSSQKVATNEFSKNSGSLFMIHVMNAPVLDVNRYANENGFLADLKEYSSECEYILLGGGTFYDSPDMTTVGFRDDADRKYSTWYRIEPRVRMNQAAVRPAPTNEDEIIARALVQINGLKEMITEPKDLNAFTVGLSLTEPIKKKIMELLLKKGGTRRKRSKHSKRHSKRRRIYMY